MIQGRIGDLLPLEQGLSRSNITFDDLLDARSTARRTAIAVAA